VWTLQEYCSAARTMIVKEDLGEHETDTDDRMAIVGREAENADAVRHQYMASVAHCVPVWLSEDIQVAVRELSANRVNDIQEMYCTLSRQRHCRFAEDAVRALYARCPTSVHCIVSIPPRWRTCSTPQLCFMAYCGNLAASESGTASGCAPQISTALGAAS